MSNSQGFDRSKRIRKKSEYEKALKSAKKQRGKFVTLSINKGSGGAKLGMIVPSRVSPRAVDRSAWKRTIREFFRCQQQKISRGAEVVFSPLCARPQPKKEIIEEMNRLLTKAFSLI